MQGYRRTVSSLTDRILRLYNCPALFSNLNLTSQENYITNFNSESQKYDLNPISFKLSKSWIPKSLAERIVVWFMVELQLPATTTDAPRKSSVLQQNNISFQYPKYSYPISDCGRNQNSDNIKFSSTLPISKKWFEDISFEIYHQMRTTVKYCS